MARLSLVVSAVFACVGLVAAATDAGAQGAAAQAPAGNPVGANWNAKVSPDNPSAQGVTLQAAQVETINKVSGYFNGVIDLKGRFIQTDAANKRMRGKFYLKRPGRFRFDYALPSKQIIVSNGTLLRVQDHDTRNEDVIELDNTPFRILLRKDVDLLRDAKVTDVQEADDTIVLTVQDKSPDTPGKIKLVLVKKPELELKEWVTTDAQGLDTRVELSDITVAEKIDPTIFDVKIQHRF